ncbi:hypothetical protein BOX15_Mlig023792g3 [Macrostomum lignano]|uniref:Fibrinogen C-terminal domain-containing protein n=2 Tax=Macrostomum lignano TaxID=282301 RepID=A0A1I8GSP1_9PLAT|nr:hypothetical protein BOX15_Mlig023792g2 [Macrostomum lignano]PAA62248.1 hypothetical protein BOX15_Mlig023792g1 [Macrostomum lignano]PAA92900.1 hypothetical protein BOX15_Mlig023792g3 [Macrostomum lignano]
MTNIWRIRAVEFKAALAVLIVFTLFAKFGHTEEAIPRLNLPYRGASLQLMQLASGQTFVEPLVAFESNGACLATIYYDYLTGGYSLTLPLVIDSTAGHPGATPFVLRELRIQATLIEGSDVRAACRLADGAGSGARLRLLCPSWERCEQIRWTLVADPAALSDFLQLSIVGGVADKLVSLGHRPVRVLTTLPGVATACGPTWTVFQQRRDSSLSFRQNWATYVRGFGNADSNYWMGLQQLSARTVGSLFYANCRLRIEVLTVSGQPLWGEWSGFKVQPANDSYRLNVTGPDSAGSLDPGRTLVNENNAMFSTFDAGGSPAGTLCSRQHAGAGWWFNTCFSILLNGLFADSPVPDDRHNVNHVHLFGTWTQISTSKMMFKCI